MPLYEYRCADCGHEQENLVRDTSVEPVCESCGSDGLRRKLSVFAVTGTASPEPVGCACAAGADCAGPERMSCHHAGGCGCA